jgi:exopolyphosphatase/guanosine-5'-triphosphate,3'-diphosphate pyrophosphatase
VDIGSNTTRLLVAERAGRSLTERLQQRVFTRLGGERGPDGSLHADKIVETARVVADQAAAAGALGCSVPRVVATAAVRMAPNRGELVAAVHAVSGLEMEILSGEEEARLAFLGATGMLAAPPAGRIGVVDVGGGSSEIVVGTAGGGVSWCASFPVGSGDLADTHLRSDPPTSEEIAAASAEVDAALRGTAVPVTDVAFAVGGSANSLRLLTGPDLDDRALAAALALLRAQPVAEVAARTGIDPVRARLLPAGIVLLQAASRLLGRPLGVSSGGLREGVLLDLA